MVKRHNFGQPTAGIACLIRTILLRLWLMTSLSTVDEFRSYKTDDDRPETLVLGPSHNASQEGSFLEVELEIHCHVKSQE
jgi:hypothetical protein